MFNFSQYKSLFYDGLVSSVNCIFFILCIHFHNHQNKQLVGEKLKQKVNSSTTNSKGIIKIGKGKNQAKK